MALALALDAGCGGGGEGGSEGRSEPRTDASGDAGGASDASTSGDGGIDATTPVASCASLKFEASGAACGASCASFSCSCPGAFPKSIAKCTNAGCLVAANCTALCALDLGVALGCTNEYSVRARVDSGVVDSSVPLSPNGAACSEERTCASGRCATVGGSGTCVVGVVGDSCGEARDCLSALCNEQRCGAWTPLRGGRIAKSSATLSELRALPDGYTVAGYGSAPDFGAGPIVSGNALFLAEYADDGGVRATTWARTANSTATVRGARLADGTRRLAGDFFTSWQAGSTQLDALSASFDLFAARFEADGGVAWAKRYGTAVVQTQRVEALAVDGSGASYITGAGGNLDFGAGAVTRSPYLAKLNADGTLAWAKAFNMDSATGQGLAVDPVDGALVWSGINGGLDDLSLDGANRTLSGIGIFLARFSAAGEHLWSKGFESFGPSARVAVGPNGEIVLAGSFRTPTSFGGETFDDRGIDDVFVARFSPSGEHLWSRSFGGASYDRALAVAIDIDGSVAVGGMFTSSADFGAGPVRAVGESDAFVMRLSASGALEALRFVQGPQADEVRSLAFHTHGLLVGGIFSGAQDFGSGSVSGGGGFVMLLPK